MRMLQTLKTLLRVKASATQRGSKFWDEWWNDKISMGLINHYLYPMLEAPLVKCSGAFVDVANSDELLINVMLDNGLARILCAGNGLSQEPRALARAGFDVTALDISPATSERAKAHQWDPNRFNYFCPPGAERPGGRLEFVVGNLLELTVCPGPYDVIIERRTVQTFPAQERPSVLKALADRLANPGIFLSLCNDGSYFTTKQVFHASEAWFKEQQWTIWNGVPSSKLSNRVAWLVRSTA